MESETPLSMSEIQERMTKLSDWEIEEGKLEKEFKFPDFKSALAFVNKVGELAEQASHHPDIYLWWGKVRLVLFTHRIKALSQDDFSLAEEIDKIQI